MKRHPAGDAGASKPPAAEPPAPREEEAPAAPSEAAAEADLEWEDFALRNFSCG